MGAVAVLFRPLLSKSLNGNATALNGTYQQTHLFVLSFVAIKERHLSVTMILIKLILNSIKNLSRNK